jgi:Na+-transporting methylmalonyl-CoA/oxaloacetate decarboxylase gamma subunit
MEIISGIKFALLLLGFVVAFLLLITLFILVLSPLIKREFDKPNEIEKELKGTLESEQTFIKEKLQKGEISSCKDVATFLERQRGIIREGLKRMRRAYNEESGSDDFHKELKKDIRDIFK